MTDRQSLERLAVEISDGAPVDWERAGSEEAPATVLENLRAIDRIATTLRSLPQSLSAVDVSALNDSFDGWTERLDGQQAEPAEPGQQWGPLEIRELLGSGAYADVYKAYDPALERELALKLFRFTDPDLQQRMLAEGRRLARIDHPNVVRVYGAAEHDGRIGLWMEHLDGDNLAPREESAGGLTPREASLVGLDLCTALAAIHGAGLLHRDVKLENVVRTNSGRIVLADLGSGIDIATQVGDLPNPGGTPRYLAPEVLAGGAASRQSDLYSLGVALFRLVTGRFPYDAPHIAALMRQQREPAPPLLDLCPAADPAFAAVVDRLLALRPEDRFESAGAVHAALQNVLGQTAPGEKSARPWPWRLVAVVAIVFVAWGLLQMNRPAPTATPAGYELALQVDRPGEARQQIGSGVGLYLGDGLSLGITLERPMHLLVFSEDDQGRAFGLFPIPGLGQSNPLAGGTTHQLPGSINGAELHWSLDSLASLERLHVVISPEPMPNIEAAYARLPSPAFADERDSVFKPRGMGSLATASSSPGGPVGPLLQAVRVYSGESEVASGTVHRVFEFEHLGPRAEQP